MLTDNNIFVLSFEPWFFNRLINQQNFSFWVKLILVSAQSIFIKENWGEMNFYHQANFFADLS